MGFFDSPDHSVGHISYESIKNKVSKCKTCDIYPEYLIIQGHEDAFKNINKNCYMECPKCHATSVIVDPPTMYTVIKMWNELQKEGS